MKNYEKPNLEEEILEIEDVIAKSLEVQEGPASPELDDPGAETIGG